MILKNLRDKASFLFVKLLLVLITISFTLWGVSDYLRDNFSSSTVARIGSTNISKNFLKTQVDQFLQKLKGSLSLEDATKIGVPRQILENTLAQIAVDLEIQNLKLTISDPSVKSYLQIDPHLQGEDGKFSPEKLKLLLERSGMTEQKLLQSIQNSLIHQQFLIATRGGLQLPAALSIGLFEALSEQRDFVFIPVRTEPLTRRPALEELKQFYQKNSQSFKQPEVRTFTFVTIDPMNLVKAEEIPEKTLKAIYETHLKNYTTPETRELVIVNVLPQDDREALKTKLLQGEMDGRFINIGYVTQDAISKKISAAVFGLQKGQVSAPIPIDQGEQLVLVKDIHPESVQSFENVRKDVVVLALKEMAQKALITLSQSVEDLIAAGTSLEEIAKKHNLKVVKIGPVDKFGKDQSGKAINVPEDALKTAFSQEEKIDGTVQEKKDGTAFIVRVDQVTPERIPAFEDIPGLIEDTWRSSEEQKIVKEKADALSKQINSARTLGSNTRQVSKLRMTREMFLEKDFIKNPSEDLVKLLYNLPLHQSLAFVDGKKIWVAYVKQIHTIKPSMDPKGYGEFTKGVTEMVEREIDQTFIQSLKEKFGAEIVEYNLTDWEKSIHAS